LVGGHCIPVDPYYLVYKAKELDVTVAHDKFMAMTLDDVKEIMNDKPVLIDVREIFEVEEVKRKGFYSKSV